MPHTPGPWVTDTDDGLTQVSVHAPWGENVRPGDSATFGDYRGAMICAAQFLHSGVPTKEQAVANAQLIAAAPDMYEALKELRGVVRGMYALSIINAAIAKAEGKEGAA